MKCPYKKITKIINDDYSTEYSKQIETDFGECDGVNCAASIFYYGKGKSFGGDKVFKGCYLLKKGANNE